jgi:hypothetical protein
VPHRPAEGPAPDLVRTGGGDEPVEEAGPPEGAAPVRRRVSFGPSEDGGWGLHATGLDEAEGGGDRAGLGAARDDLFRGSSRTSGRG